LSIRPVHALFAVSFILFGASAHAEKMTVRNRTLLDPQTIYVALYQCGTNNCDRAQGPWEIEVGESYSFEKTGDKVGFIRKLRWSTNKADLKSTLRTKGEWDKVGGHVNFGPAGNGYQTCNVSDKGKKGQYESKTDTGEWISNGWSNLWDSVWGPLSAAGDPCQIINTTTIPLYITEYERKTQLTGSLKRLQGGTGAAWRVEPGQSITFFKKKLEPGYTARWVRWMKRDDPPETVASATWNGYSGTKSDLKLVNKIFLEYNEEGVIDGLTTLELQIRRLKLLNFVFPVIQKRARMLAEGNPLKGSPLAELVKSGAAFLNDLKDPTDRVVQGLDVLSREKNPFEKLDAAVNEAVSEFIPTGLLEDLSQRFLKAAQNPLDLIEAFDPSKVSFSDPKLGETLFNRFTAMGLLPRQLDSSLLLSSSAPNFAFLGAQVPICLGVIATVQGTYTFRGVDLNGSVSLCYYHQFPTPEVEAGDWLGLYFSGGPSKSTDPSVKKEASLTIGGVLFWGTNCTPGGLTVSATGSLRSMASALSSLPGTKPVLGRLSSAIPAGALGGIDLYVPVTKEPSTGKWWPVNGLSFYLDPFSLRSQKPVGATFAVTGWTQSSLFPSMSWLVPGSSYIIPDQISLETNLVMGGDKVSGDLLLGSTAPPGGLSIALKSSNPTVAPVPPSLQVVWGNSSQSFTIQTAPVEKKTTIELTAYRGNRRIATKVLTVCPKQS